ncbi:Arm DNA-binding domain-containing protein [Amycolatopsis sp. NPDC051061]|uniref:Arm DNA-binding domain-containing protein n=1 Tax=Amycolatopsis sp. NPDC051061 TaxID=3155042 RepID=UPI00343061B6
MAEGSVYKRCSCKDGKGRGLGTECPRLEQSKHGQWCYRIELPADRGGKRRPRRRSGFATAKEAQKELDHVGDLLAIAGDDDEDTLGKIADVIAAAITARKTLPELEDMRRLVRAGAEVLEHPLMGDVFTAFLAKKRRPAAATPTARTSRTCGSTSGPTSGTSAGTSCVWPTWRGCSTRSSSTTM